MSRSAFEKKTTKRIYNDIIKRALDIAVAIPVLIVGAIPMALTAAAIRMESPGSAIFRQARLGLHGKEFNVLKFRSMYVNSEHTGSGVYSDRNDSRVTAVGRVIRALSIDELPQVFNILKGEMSFIGPRPPLTYHPWPIGEYTDEQRRMFEVRPGITGWAQIHGRKQVEWNERIRLNVWYVDHVSFPLDVQIFFKTIRAVITCKNNENVGETLKKTEVGAVE